LQEGEAFFRNDEVEEALLGADRTVAVEGARLVDLDPETHRPTVAPAFVGLHFRDVTR
jgi:hypothetical protein